MKSKKNINQIVGLLSYGNFWGISPIKIIATFIAISVFSFLADGLGIYLLISEYRNNQNSLEIIIFAIVMLTIIIIVFLICILIVIIKNSQMRKNVLVWMEDAVKLRAYSKRIDSKGQFFGFFPSSKIKVDFIYEGVKHSHVSESKFLNKWAVMNEGGYYRLWNKYSNREINIYYSPKFNQIMVIRD